MQRSTVDVNIRVTVIVVIINYMIIKGGVMFGF